MRRRFGAGDEAMAVERSRSLEFNQPGVDAGAPDITLDWKATSLPVVEFNAFWPEDVVGNVMLKTPALYELLGNSLLDPISEDEVTHSLKARAEWIEDRNLVAAGEIPDRAEMVSLLTKTQS